MMKIRRWKCVSYCICTPSGTARGHFEWSDAGVWILAEDLAPLIAENSELKLKAEEAEHSRSLNHAAAKIALEQRDAAISASRALVIANTNLVAELAAARKDAARWRHVIDCCEWEIWCLGDGDYYDSGFHKHVIDSKVDAAMKEPTP